MIEVLEDRVVGLWDMPIADYPHSDPCFQISNRFSLYCGAGAEDAVGAVIGGGTDSTCLI
jgi:hypothetical protein